MNGRLIRERRAAAGLTVRQLADQLGVDARTLADLERSSGHDARAVRSACCVVSAKRSIWSLLR